jgi:pimeloyl-ACP methyl ester carboxylesterase
MRAVCEVLAAVSEPAFVVGHSMGGIVATQAAAQCPERVAALVYVAAFRLPGVVLLRLCLTTLTLLHFACKRYKGFKSRHREWA